MARSTATRNRRKNTAPPRAADERGGQVQSLVRALNVLNAIAEADSGVTLTDVAQKVGLPPSTAHRLLTTLQQEQYVHFDPERTLWSVGFQAFVVGNAFINIRNLVQIARPHMQDLMEESGETVNLAVEDKGEAVFLAQVECRQFMRALASPGARVGLHCSGLGKALLAAMPEARLSRILHRKGLPKLTKKTVDRPADLRRELALTVQRGYAIDDEEHSVGLRCVAADIRDETGTAIAAVSISGPAARIPDGQLAVLGDMVRRTADAITREFGGGTT